MLRNCISINNFMILNRMYIYFLQITVIEMMGTYISSLWFWIECSFICYRLPYSEEDLHTHLCRYLDSARLCWCGGFCFERCVRATTSFSLKTLSPTVSAVDMRGRTDVPILLFLCSPQCQRKYKTNPYAYWR